MGRNEPFRKNGLGFAKLFSGKGIAKPRLMFLKFGGDFEFRPRGGRVWEGIRAGFFSDFFGGHKKEKYIILKSRQSRDTKFVLCLTHITRVRVMKIFYDLYKSENSLMIH
jgi:hypothetical protein